MQDAEEEAKQGSGGQGLPADPLFFPLSKASSPHSLPGSDWIPLKGTLSPGPWGFFVCFILGFVFSGFIEI